MPCKNCNALDGGEITVDEWETRPIYGISLYNHHGIDNHVYPSCIHCHREDKESSNRSIKALKIIRRL